MSRMHPEDLRIANGIERIAIALEAWQMATRLEAHKTASEVRANQEAVEAKHRWIMSNFAESTTPGKITRTGTCGKCGNHDCPDCYPGKFLDAAIARAEKAEAEVKRLEQDVRASEAMQKSDLGRIGALKARVAELEADARREQEELLAVLPEDWSAPEYIRHLEANKRSEAMPQCSRCLKLYGSNSTGEPTHDCTPTPLVRELESALHESEARVAELEAEVQALKPYRYMHPGTPEQIKAEAAQAERERCHRAVCDYLEIHEVDHLEGPGLDATIRKVLEVKP